MRNLSEFLPPEHILLGLQARDMKGCLSALTGQLVEKNLLTREQCKQLDQALLTREQLGATCIGHGVAIPHAYLDGIDAAKIFFARLDHSFKYQAPDEEPVDLLFLLTGPEGAPVGHLQTLARIVRLAQDRQLLEALRRASTVEEVREAIQQVEQRHA